MTEFQIFSDGAADIQPHIAQENSITIVPFYVSLDGVTYRKEVEELAVEEYYKEFIQKNLFPKTSLPSVQDYIDAFTPALESGKDVICFNLTLSLSGSHQSALAAKEILEETYTNAKIYVMNTWLATGLQELLVLEAVRMKNDGLSIDQVWEKCHLMREKARILFMVGGLEHLQKGGRIGKVGAAAGGILKIKPLIELKNGEISLVGVTRSRKAGLKKLSDTTKNYFATNNENPMDYLFTVGSTNIPEENPIFKQELENLILETTFTENFIIGATISAHTGPGTIGVCFIKKYDKV